HPLPRGQGRQVLVLDPDGVALDERREGESALVAPGAVEVGAVDAEPLVLERVGELVDEHLADEGRGSGAAHQAGLRGWLVAADHGLRLGLPPRRRGAHAARADAEAAAQRGQAWREA